MRQWPEDDDTLRRIFDTSRTWAVVGCSPNPARDSHRVAAYVRSLGYRVIPIRPDCDEVLGERCYPTLGSIPADIAGRRGRRVPSFGRGRRPCRRGDRRSARGRCGSSSASSTRRRPSGRQRPVWTWPWTAARRSSTRACTAAERVRPVGWRQRPHVRLKHREDSSPGAMTAQSPRHGRPVRSVQAMQSGRVTRRTI